MHVEPVKADRVRWRGFQFVAIMSHRLDPTSLPEIKLVKQQVTQRNEIAWHKC